MLFWALPKNLIPIIAEHASRMCSKKILGMIAEKAFVVLLQWLQFATTAMAANVVLATHMQHIARKLVTVTGAQQYPEVLWVDA